MLQRAASRHRRHPNQVADGKEDKTRKSQFCGFEAVLMREKRTKGYFVAFGYSEDAMREIDAFFRREHKSIVAFTVQEILEGEIARKLA